MRGTSPGESDNANESRVKGARRLCRTSRVQTPLSVCLTLSLIHTHTHTHTHTKEHLTEFLPTSKGPCDKREGPCPSGAPHQETRALMGAIWLQKSIPQSLLPPSPQPSLVSPHGELIAEFLKTCTAFMPQLVGSKGSFFFFFFLMLGISSC